MNEKKLQRARKMIERGKADLLFDLCAEHGQIFDNVKHMRWFVELVAENL